MTGRFELKVQIEYYVKRCYFPRLDCRMKLRELEL